MRKDIKAEIQERGGFCASADAYRLTSALTSVSSVMLRWLLFADTDSLTTRQKRSHRHGVDFMSPCSSCIFHNAVASRSLNSLDHQTKRTSNRLAREGSCFESHSIKERPERRSTHSCRSTNATAFFNTQQRSEGRHLVSIIGFSTNSPIPSSKYIPRAGCRRHKHPH